MVIIVACLIIVPTSYFLGRVLLRPLAEQQPPPKHVQFLLTDLYALLLQLMFSGYVVFKLPNPDLSGTDQQRRLWIMLPLWAVLGWWWWLGVRRLSRAGILKAWPRAVFLVVAVPFAFGNFLWLIVLVAVARSGNLQVDAFNAIFLAAFVFTLFMVFSGCRWLAEWAVSASLQHSERQDAEL